MVQMTLCAEEHSRCIIGDRVRSVAECWTAGSGYDQLWCCCRT